MATIVYTSCLSPSCPHTLEGKRQRGELLVLLKDRAGLKYKEIGEFDIFGDLKLGSLREIYRNMKRRGI
jgi:hypothetical protein